MGQWSKLSAIQKATIIRTAIKNGVSDINTIRDTYNIYAKDSLANVDYNMAAAKAAGFGSNDNGHYPDTFKKPNHPTFSDESIYHSEETPGGRWRGNTYEPSDFVLNQQGGWNQFLRAFYNQEQGTGAVPVFNGGVMVPEITASPQYKEGGGIHIDPSKKGTFTAAASKHGKSVQAFASQVLAHKENYSPAMVKKAVFAHNSSKWHKHEDGGSNWLPDFALDPSKQSDNGRQLVQSILQDEGLQKAVQQKALQRQAEREASRKAVSEIYNGMPNPGAGFLSGTDPLLQAIVDMTPAGDAEMATEAVSELKSGNLKEAGILGVALLIPNAFNKGFKEWQKGRKLSKELSEIPLVQTVSDDEINNWLAERWYKNETHSLPPRKVERFNIDPDDFGKDGIPLNYRLENNFPTIRKSPENVLIHVDNRIPIQAKREGFAPLPGHTEDAPAIWWQRNYPYYTSPTSLTAVGGHTLKVKEGNVKALEPTRRYEGAPGPVVVTEGILPYEAIEGGIKINPEQTWFEREIFQRSPKELDYFKGKYLPKWFTFATGGPLYPFSFQRNPYLKTPIVRY